MTDTMFTRTALVEAAEKAEVTLDQARTILETAGVKVQPEKPALPTEPGSVIIATEVRGVKGRWRMMLDRKGVWFSAEMIGGYHWHYPGDITKSIEATVVPAAASVTLTEDQVGVVWSKESGLLVEWSVLGSRNREAVTTTVNAALAQYAAPAEGEPIASAAKPIDPNDVRKGDRVHLVLDSGDEVTITVQATTPNFLCAREHSYNFDIIRAAHLLHREDQS